MRADSEEDPIVGLVEAAGYVGVPKAQMLRWAGWGVGPERLSGSPFAPASLRYRRSHLDDWLAHRHERALI